MGNELFAYGKQSAGKKARKNGRSKKEKVALFSCLSARLTLRGAYFISETANQSHKSRAAFESLF